MKTPTAVVDLRELSWVPNIVGSSRNPELRNVVPVTARNIVVNFGTIPDSDYLIPRSALCSVVFHPTNLGFRS